MVVGGPCSISGCRRSTMYGSTRCYKHKELATDDDSYIEQIQPHSVSKDNAGSRILFNIDGNDFSIPSKNIDEIIAKISEANQFWTVELGLDSNEFIQYSIDNEELEHWNDSKMLESVGMSHENALSTLKEKISDPNLSAGFWWKVEGGETKIEDSQNTDFFWNLIAIPVAIFFVLILGMSFFSNSGNAFLSNIPAELCCYGLMAIGGMRASMSRTKEGRFENN